MHQVVALLATDLGDEVAQRLERRLGQRREARRVGGLVQVAPGDRRRPVAAAMVEEPGVKVTLGRAIVGDGVGVAAIRDDLGEQAVERLGVTQLVLCQRADRHILLEDRSDPRPFGVAEADDELVVRHRQQQQCDGALPAVTGVGEVHRDALDGLGFGHRSPLFARGFCWPLASRAAASFSRIT